MKKIFLFSFILFFLAGCSIIGIHFKIHNPKRAGSYRHDNNRTVWLLGTLTKYRTCFDVKYNQLNIIVDPQREFISGIVSMMAVATTDFDTLQVDLFKNMKMNSISFEGKKINFTRKLGAVFVAMPRKIKTNETFMLMMDYEGKPVTAHKPPWDGGFVWKKDRYDNPWIGVACETEGASLWWPCKDHNSDEADSTLMSITVPTGLVAVCNGKFRDSASSLEGKNVLKFTTFNWFVSYPINNYDVTLYIGKFKLLHDTYESKETGKTLDMNHYVLWYNYDRAEKHFPQAKKIIAFYEKTYGAYPWYRDGFKYVESPYEGMEHQTAIAYGQGYKNTPGEDFDYIILHETAHEWWGNSITASDLSDVWIQEGMATYAEALYVEAMQGKDASIKYLANYWITIINRRPMVGPVGRRWFWYKDGDVYVKGAWMMHTLRHVINNDSLFFDILKTFREEYNCKTVNSHDFINWVNKKTGTYYNWFFSQYLDNRFTPVFEYQVKGKLLYYRWIYANNDFKMKIPAHINGSNEAFILEPGKDIAVHEFDSDINTMSLSEDLQLYGIKDNSHLEKEYKTWKKNLYKLGQ